MSRVTKLFATFGLALALSGSLSGCNEQKASESASLAGPGGYRVDKLFTHEGCTVYRFDDSDALRDRKVYFTKCEKAEVTTTDNEYRCGKGCIRRDVIETENKE